MSGRRWSADLALFAALLTSVTSAQEPTVVVPNEAQRYWEIFERCRSAKHPADTLDLHSFGFVEEAFDFILRDTNPKNIEHNIEHLLWTMSICQEAKDVRAVRFRRTEKYALLETTYIDRADEKSAILFVFVDDPDRGPVTTSWHANLSPDRIDLLEECENGPPLSFGNWFRCSAIGQAIGKALAPHESWRDEKE